MQPGLSPLRSVPDHGLMLSVPGDRKLHLIGARADLTVIGLGHERPQRKRHFLPNRERPLYALGCLASNGAPPRAKASAGMRCHFILPLYEPVERSLAESAIRRASVF